MNNNHYFEIHEAIEDYPELFPNNNAKIVFAWLIRRILRWGKVRDVVMAHHFNEGVYTNKGEYIQGRCTLPPRTRARGLASLNKIEFVNSDYINGRLYITIDVKRILKLVSKLKLSKKRTESEKATRMPIWHTPSANMAHIKKDYITKDKESSKPSLAACQQQFKDANDCKVKTPSSTGLKDLNPPNPPADSDSEVARELDANVAGVLKRSRGRVAAEAKSVDEHPTRKNVLAKWRELTSELDGCRERIDNASWGAFIKVYNGGALEKTTLSAFMEWSIEEWGDVIYDNLYWMDGRKGGVTCTKTPSLNFLCRNFSRITTLHAHRASTIISGDHRTARTASAVDPQGIEQLRAELVKEIGKRQAAEDALVRHRDTVIADSHATRSAASRRQAEERSPEQVAEWEKQYEASRP